MDGRYLIYVHGISDHPPGYSNAWWQALRPHTQVFGEGALGASRREVLWSDLVNDAHAASRMNAAGRRARDSMEMQVLRQRIQDVLEDRLRREVAASAPEWRVRLAAAELPSVRAGVFDTPLDFALDDFLRYMVNDATRQRIIDRFTAVVRPLLASSSRLDLITHSWGTVVAYEGLRELDPLSALTGRVSNFFTVGSALSIPPVRWYLRDENEDGRRPRLVERWINLDAQGDLVGGALADWFAVDVEQLDLAPTGCTRNLGGWGWFSPACAHSSYFVAGNVAVNRDVFARRIGE